MANLAIISCDQLGATATAQCNGSGTAISPRDQITLLTSRWKSGKTTLISLLVARMGKRRRILGSASMPGCVVVVSGGSPQCGRAVQRIGSAASQLVCRPFQRETRRRANGRADRRFGRARPVRLTVIDPLASVPGSDENNAVR